MFEIIIWLLIAFLVVVIDIVTSSFIFMWFSIGAIVAIILSLLGLAIKIQILAFLIIGIAMVCVGYPWVKKKFKVEKNHIPLMEQTYIGKIMTAEKDIDEKSEIKVSGIYWTAINKGPKINKGDKFVITGIEGNKLTVKLKED